MALKIALHGRYLQDKYYPFLKKAIDLLTNNGAELSFTDEFEKLHTKFFKSPAPGPVLTRDDELSHLDFIISLGGDGTLLDTITYVRDRNIPIMGINLGRLGFLATITTDELEAAVACIFNNNFAIDERSLIRMNDSEGVFGNLNFALNEFAIQKRDTSSMIVVHTFIDGQFLNAYWADGLIVSTPTGSTGYSMSCGGPLVLPQSNNFIITPIAPHNLNVRPMVVNDKSSITFQIEGRAKNFLVSLDSRSKTVNDSIDIEIVKEDFTAKLVKFHDYVFFDTLRSKLHWGVDARN